jgi:hypothetical protein
VNTRWQTDPDLFRERVAEIRRRFRENEITPATFRVQMFNLGYNDNEIRDEINSLIIERTSFPRSCQSCGG